MAIPTPYTVCFPPKTEQELHEEAAIYKKYDDLISTLPQSSQTRTKLSLFKGFWFPNGTNFGLKVLQGTMAARDHFISRPDDIILATLPKVGTTWLKALAFATLSRSNHPFPQSLLLSLNPHQCVPFLEYQLYANNRIPNLDCLPSPRLLATHIPYSLLPKSVLESETSKVVYLCRNPRDTFISMWKFANSLLPKGYEPAGLEESLKEFLSGAYTSGPFWDNVIEYRGASVERPSKVLFLTYEELKREPEAAVRKLAEFMGRPFSGDEEREGALKKIVELCSLESLTSLEVNQRTNVVEFWSAGFNNKAFFRKGEVGDWINYLSPEMVEKFDKVMKQKLKGTGVAFE